VTNNNGIDKRQATRVVRCAVYTRKSTEEGLQQEFNSLDAQRESAEAFIRSQAGEGWALVPDRYDDGGFSGGSMDRPAVRRLMADIEVGKIDCVVVYKVDRLSRSLLDFARMMETFERHGVSFSAVSQQFSTTHSMGRLTLNILLSFAQFEREIIAERTRDKIAATRRKGKWSGGQPILGYDVDRGVRLVVNEAEAVRVRQIFDLYLEHESLLPVVRELEQRGWRNKRWITRGGSERGGAVITKTALHRLLTNVVYAGRVRYKKEVHAGEQPAIIDPAVFVKAQDLLRRNARTGGAIVRNQFGALLKGILHCGPCDCSMTPAHTTKGNRRYRYYTCTAAQSRGWSGCPSKSIPAAEIERVVIERIRCIGSDPALLRDVLTQLRARAASRTQDLEAEDRTLAKDLSAWHGEVRELSSRLGAGESGGSLVARLADLQERIGAAERRAEEVRDQLEDTRQRLLDDRNAAEALAAFDPVWARLTPQEQSRLLGLLIRRVDYDGSRGKLTIHFHDTGIQALADDLAGRQQEIRA
jgi:site-specific DNA recombinase